MHRPRIPGLSTPESCLAQHPRVIATPHIGGLTLPAIEHQALETVTQTADILHGQIPTGAVNADFATRMRDHGVAATPQGVAG